jgi:hypothetical protein
MTTKTNDELIGELWRENQQLKEYKKTLCPKEREVIAQAEKPINDKIKANVDHMERIAQGRGKHLADLRLMEGDNENNG